MTDNDELRSKAAISELQQQLRDAYTTALRLKRDIPGEQFPAAYDLSNKIRDLRKAVEYLRAELNDETLELDVDLSIFAPDQLDSSESSASIC